MQEKRRFDIWKNLPVVALVFVLIFVWIAYAYNSMPGTQIEYIDVAMYDFIFLSSFLIGTFVFCRAINKRMSKSWENRGIVSFFIAAFLVLFLLSMFFTGNRAFDENYPSEPVRIMNKEISYSKGTHHRLVVFYEGKEYTLSVSEQTYTKYSVGEAFPVTPSEGFFGIAYLEYER